MPFVSQDHQLAKQVIEGLKAMGLWEIYVKLLKTILKNYHSHNTFVSELINLIVLYDDFCHILVTCFANRIFKLIAKQYFCLVVKSSDSLEME